MHACKKANVFDDVAQKIMNVLHEITYRKRCRGSGARTPPWLKRLVDAVADDDDDFVADTDAKSVVSNKNGEESFGPKTLQWCHSKHLCSLVTNHEMKTIVLFA